MPKCKFCGKEAFVPGWLCQGEEPGEQCRTSAPEAMTEQLYRRRAGEPVRVWEVGTEPVPEWAANSSWACAVYNSGWRGFLVLDGLSVRHLTNSAFARDYEPVPEPAPDAREALEAACEPWRFHVGEPPGYDSPLSAVYGAGMHYTEELLASLLGVTHYDPGDGSEDFRTDAGQTLMNILTAAGLYDDETGQSAALARMEGGR